MLILSGCDQNSDQREFERQAFREPSGITVTSQNGQVQSIDPDDWRIAPFFQGDIDFVTYPHPNPVQSNEELRIEIRVNILDRISGIYILVWRFNEFPLIDSREQVTTGITTFSLNPIIIAGRQTNPQGFYRIIIQDQDRNVISYGDIEIK